MGVFKYRESAGAEWQELAMIGDINMGSSGGGFSADTHDTIILNNAIK